MFSLPLEGIFRTTWVSKIGFKSILKLAILPNEVTFAEFSSVLSISSRPQRRFKRTALKVIWFSTLWNVFCHFNTLHYCSLCAQSDSQFSLHWSSSEVTVMKISFCTKRSENNFTKLLSIDIYVRPSSPDIL